MTEEAISGDVITPARLRQADVEIKRGTRGGISFETTQLPIDVYLRRKTITVDEYGAANRLYRDFSMSGQTSGMTINLDPVRGGVKGFTEKQLEARERWRLAIGAVGGNIGKMMIINVCCYGYYLSEISYRYYKDSSRAMARLHEALAELVEHYNKPLDRDNLDRIV